MRILLAEDEDVQRLAFLYLLQGHAHRIETCARGTEAMDMFLRAMEESAPYDVVIADQVMPGSSGVALLDEIRRRNPRTLRVMLTAHPDVFKDAVSLARVHHFLTKPLDVKALLDLLSEHEARLARSNGPPSPR